MRNVRIIPVVLYKNARVVQSKKFKRHQVLGDHSTIVNRLSNWCSDELIYLDISRTRDIGLQRTDLKNAVENDFLSAIDHLSKQCFMPLSVGGGICNLEHIYLRLSKGADKVCINSEFLRNRSFIKEASKEFGSQCIVASIDCAKVNDNTWKIYSEFGKTQHDISPTEYIKDLCEHGVGEILLNSIDRDGSGQGMDLNLIEEACKVSIVPLVVQGGVGTWEHFSEVIKRFPVSGVAAANIFQYSENSVYNARKFLFDQNLPVRMPYLNEITNSGG